MREMRGRSAIITGASSGIGEAAARQLAALGVNVVLAARRTDRLQTLADRIAADGGTVLVQSTDVTRRDQVERLVEVSLDRFGAVDILINNAGIMPLSFLRNLHLDEWERMVDVNLKGVLFATGAVLPSMMARKSGHIVNVSSVAGRRVFPSGAVYCATKFAVTALSEGLRAELSATEGIRVTVIEPGAVATELTDTITDEEVLDYFRSRGELRKLDAEDIAASIVYAVSQPDHVNVSEVLVMPTQQS